MHHRASNMNQARSNMERSAKSIMNYKSGGSMSADEKQDAAMIHKHERHDHPGTPLTKFKRGGKIGGHSAKHHAGGKSRVHINIITGAGEAEKRQAMQNGVAMGAKLGAAAAQQPPMPPGAGGPPMGGPPPGAPAFKSGGVVNIKTGSAGGQGRIAKAVDYGAGSAGVRSKLKSKPHNAKVGI